MAKFYVGLIPAAILAFILLTQNSLNVHCLATSAHSIARLTVFSPKSDGVRLKKF